MASLNASLSFKILPSVAHTTNKAGIIVMTRQVVVEGREHGISAMCLSPGAVDTEMLRAANPELRPGLVPEDVAELIAELLDGPINAASGAILPLFSNR